jgi:hypothetical protein
VFAAGADAGLTARADRRRRARHGSGEDAFKGHHARVCKQQAIIIWHQRRAGDDLMALARKKIQIFASNIHDLSYFKLNFKGAF